MKFVKAFRHALNMVLHSKLRSWLTILGIVIGVAAVISIISIGEALEQDINSQFDTVGADLLTITAGASRAGGPPWARRSGGASATDEEVVLDRTDVQALKGLSDVLLVDTQIRGNVDSYYLGKQGSVSVTGVDQAVWYQVTTEEIAEGRMLGPADTNVIVVGGRLANDFFDVAVGVNQMIALEDRSFRIVGILDDESTSVYMPILSAYPILDDKDRDVYDSLIVKIRNADDLDNALANVEKRLMVIRHVSEDDKDFSISTGREWNERRSEFINSLTTFLTAIAAVALLVGAVGIANTMFTSVLEKTKEIGIMKAIGARNRDILVIFMLNAALIGMIGGLIGTAFGYLLSGVLPALMGGAGGIVGRFGQAGSIITLESVILAMSISIGIGMIAGIVPAYQASKLKPVDALRYE